MKTFRQVAALPVRLTAKGKLEVLLVTSRDTRRWIVPKGWPWKDHSDAEAAAGEAREEAGVVGEVRAKPIGSFSYIKRRKQGDVPVDVDVYVIDVVKLLEKWAERGERDRRWFPVEEAAEQADDPELGKLIRSLIKSR